MRLNAFLASFVLTWNVNCVDLLEATQLAKVFVFELLNINIQTSYFLHDRLLV